MKKIFLLICFLFFLSGCQSATRTVFITEDQKESSINVTDTLKTIDNSTSISPVSYTHLTLPTIYSV